MPIKTVNPLILSLSFNSKLRADCYMACVRSVRCSMETTLPQKIACLASTKLSLMCFYKTPVNEAKGALQITAISQVCQDNTKFIAKEDCFFTTVHHISNI